MKNQQADAKVAAATQAQGYADALVKKGWTPEAAEKHWLVSTLRRAAK